MNSCLNVPLSIVHAYKKRSERFSMGFSKNVTDHASYNLISQLQKNKFTLLKSSGAGTGTRSPLKQEFLQV